MTSGGRAASITVWSNHPSIPIALSTAGLAFLAIGLLTPHGTRANSALTVEFGAALGLSITYGAKYYLLKHFREAASGTRSVAPSFAGLITSMLLIHTVDLLHTSLWMAFGAMLLPVALAYPEQKAVWLEARRIRGLQG